MHEYSFFSWIFIIFHKHSILFLHEYSLYFIIIHSWCLTNTLTLRWCPSPRQHEWKLIVHLIADGEQPFQLVCLHGKIKMMMMIPTRDDDDDYSFGNLDNSLIVFHLSISIVLFLFTSSLHSGSFFLSSICELFVLGFSESRWAQLFVGSRSKWTAPCSRWTRAAQSWACQDADQSRNWLETYSEICPTWKLFWCSVISTIWILMLIFDIDNQKFSSLIRKIWVSIIEKVANNFCLSSSQSYI